MPGKVCYIAPARHARSKQNNAHDSLTRNTSQPPLNARPPLRVVAFRLTVPTVADLLSETDRKSRHIQHGHGVLLHAGAAPAVHERAGREVDDHERRPAAHGPLVARWLPGGETRRLS